MDVLSSVLAIVLSLGIAQGFVFALLLWNKSADHAASRYKAILFFLLAYGLLNQVLRLFDIGYYDVWYHLTLDLDWSYGPLLYLYVKAQVTQDAKISRRDRWVLIPILFQIVCSIYVRSQNFFWDGTRESLSWLGYWGYMFWMNYPSMPLISSALIIVFSILSWRLLSDLDARAVEDAALRSIRRMLMLFGGYYVLVFGILAVDFFVFIATEDLWYFFSQRIFFYPYFVGIAVLIYWLGIMTLLYPEQALLRSRKELSDEDRILLDQLVIQLRSAMEEEALYKDPDLNLARLASHIGVKPYLVTKALNEMLVKSFTDFVNEYRVKEFERLIQTDSGERFTLLSLGFEVGFNSKSSFNRAVKKHTGQLPSELKRKT